MAAVAASRAPGRGPGASSRQDPRGARRLLPPGRHLPPRPRAPRRPGPPPARLAPSVAAWPRARPACGLELSGSTGDGDELAAAAYEPRRLASLSLPPLPLPPSLSCGCRIRLRGAVTMRTELGPAAGPRGAWRGARSFGPALRGAGGAWPRSAAARSGPRGGWARPAAGHWSPDGRARFF